MDTETKSLFQSKTIVFNLLVAVAAVVAYFIPAAEQFVQDNAVLVLALLGVVNLGLRRLTRSAYQLFPQKDSVVETD